MKHFKGPAAYAAKTECTKNIWGRQIPQIFFVHFVCIALQCKLFEQIYVLSFSLVRQPLWHYELQNGETQAREFLHYRYK